MNNLIKVYVLSKVTFGDFDSEIKVPVAVSASKETLLAEKTRLESKKYDVETYFKISDSKVALI